MIFGKKKDTLVGLDIGSSTIKVGEVIDGKEKMVLKNFGTASVPPGLIEEGTITDLDAVAEIIKELFRSEGIKEQNVALSIGGYSVIVKKIGVNKMEEEELQEAIQLEAEQYIPFDINDVNLDFQILGEDEHNPQQMGVFLVAAKKEMVTEYIELSHAAGLNPVIIDIEAFALQNIYEFAYQPSEEDNVALIDIGANKTSLNILKGINSVFMRDVSLGCSQINQRIATLAECSPEEAEALKLNPNSEKISENDLKEIVSSVVSDWCTEIRRAIDFFYSTYPEDNINRILLSGGGAHIAEFRDLLGIETSADVEIINPFQAFEIDSSLTDSKKMGTFAPQAAICMGLSIRRADDK